MWCLCLHRINELQFPSQDLLVEKQDRVERLVLGTRSHFALDGQFREKFLQLGSPKSFQLFAPGMRHEALDPADVGGLSAERVMHQAKLPPHLLNPQGLVRADHSNQAPSCHPHSAFPVVHFQPRLGAAEPV